MKLVNIEDIIYGKFYIAYNEDGHTAHTKSSKTLFILRFTAYAHSEYYNAVYYARWPWHNTEVEVGVFRLDGGGFIYELDDEEVTRCVVMDQL